MKSLNKIELIGYVGQKYDFKKSQSGVDHISFSMATSEKKNKDAPEVTQWHRMLAFGKTAEIINQYVEKGHRLYIEGKLSYGEYTNKEGIKVKTTDIIVNNVIMLSKSDNPITEVKKSYAEEPINFYDDKKDFSEDDIPFN